MKPRVASLLPSATEIICALGGLSNLVGVSHECDFPPEVKRLPVLTRSKAAPESSSAEIDKGIHELVRTSLAVYDIDIDQLAELQPDLIVTQDLCDVCAVSFTDVQQAVQSLEDKAVDIIRLNPHRLSDIWQDIRKTGMALNREAEADRLLGRLLDRVVAVRNRAAHAFTWPKVLTVEWMDPVMPGGLWMAELVEIAGGKPLLSEPGVKSYQAKWEELASIAPEVVLIKPCGFTLERSLKEVSILKRTLPWESWPTTRQGHVFIADGHAYFNRPGPRIVDSLEILAACLHPGLFPELRETYRDCIVRVLPNLSTETW